MGHRDPGGEARRPGDSDEAAGQRSGGPWAWRPDGRAVNGSFAQPVGTGPDRWLSATSAGYDVSVWLTDVFGNRIGTGAITFSGCGSGPCIRTNSVYAFKGRFSSAGRPKVPGAG